MNDFSHICKLCGQPFPCPNSACGDDAGPVYVCPSCVANAPNVVRQSDGLVMVYPDDFPPERMVGVPLTTQVAREGMRQV